MMNQSAVARMSRPRNSSFPCFGTKRGHGSNIATRSRAHFNGHFGVNQSKIVTAEAITVVQRPRLSPTADCVTFAVRTILLEMR